MGEARTASAKYIFLDVVRYSQGRSVEAQTDIIATLNELVRGSTADMEAPPDRTIFLPTGDGICIALLDMDAPYDLHLQIALKLLERLDTYNSQTADAMRKFQIRVGINANVDNLVTDIKGNPNVAGAGINLAQRVMGAADGDQILVGDPVFQTLRHREKYMKSFRSFTATAKHGETLPMHQLVEPHPGLDTATPSVFRVAEREEPKLTKFAAYYFAHAINNREFLKKLVAGLGGQECYSAVVLLARLAGDSVGSSDASEINPYRPCTWKAHGASFAEQFKYYNSQDFWLVSDLSDAIIKGHLWPYMNFFDRSMYSFAAHFVAPEGREKLKREWPSIWEQFRLGATEPPPPFVT